MIKQKQIFILFILIMFSSCSIYNKKFNEEYNKYLDTQIGLSKDDLISSWGATKSIKINDRQELFSYERWYGTDKVNYGWQNSTHYSVFNRNNNDSVLLVVDIVNYSFNNFNNIYVPIVVNNIQYIPYIYELEIRSIKSVGSLFMNLSNSINDIFLTVFNTPKIECPDSYNSCDIDIFQASKLDLPFKCITNFLVEDGKIIKWSHNGNSCILTDKVSANDSLNVNIDLNKIQLIGKLGQPKFFVKLDNNTEVLTYYDNKQVSYDYYGQKINYIVAECFTNFTLKNNKVVKITQRGNGCKSANKNIYVKR